MLRKSINFIPAYIFGGLIIFGSTISPRKLYRLRRINEFFDIIFSNYSLHFFGYGLFAVFLAWGYYKNKSSLLLVKAGLIACLFGSTIEVYQKFLPHRDFSFVDMSVDYAGIILALGLFWFVVVKKHLFGL